VSQGELVGDFLLAGSMEYFEATFWHFLQRTFCSACALHEI
jgi:hypothetical protein